jgi:predicted phage-related endonuclease
MLIEAKLLIYSDKELWGNPLSAQQMHPDTLQESLIPAMYYDQAMSHFMRFPDVEVCLLPVMFNYTSKPEVYWVKRNNERIAEIQKTCWKFWRDSVIGETPPDKDASQGMAHYLALQEATSEMYAPATDRAIDLMELWYKAKDKQNNVSDELDAVANELKEMITSTGGWGLTFGDARLHFKPNKNGRRTFSTKGLSRELFIY